MNTEEIQQELLNAARRVLKSIDASRVETCSVERIIEPVGNIVEDFRTKTGIRPPYNERDTWFILDMSTREASHSSGLPGFVLEQHREWLAGQVRKLTATVE
jgi:hypothetical protein